MKSMLRMSDAELAQVQAGSGFAVGPAFGVAATSAVMSMAGMMLRYSPGDVVPLAGMDTIAGQCFWAGILGAGLLAAAYAVQTLLMKRLQWAVLISLAVHLAICGALNVVKVDVPMALAAELGNTDRPPRDITMPDYGGVESDSQQQEWERPTDVDIPEAEQQQLDRQQSEIEIDVEVDPVEIQRRVAEAMVPERQQQQQERLEREQQLEMERQQRETEVDVPQEVEVPRVETANTEQLNLEAQAIERSRSELDDAQRQMEEQQRRNDAQVSAARVERANVRPENNLRAELQERQRESAEVRAVVTTTEAIQVAAAADARQVTAEARAIDAARQSQADLAAQSQSEANRSMASPQMQVSSATPTRAQNRATTDATPSSGGAAAMQRSASASGQNTSAADTNAQSVTVASVSGATAPNLTAATASSDVARGAAAVPTGASSGGGSPSMTANRFGVSTVQSGTSGRSRGSQTGPQMGDAVAALTASGNGQRTTTRGDAASAIAGNQAAAVSVGSAAAGNDAAGRLLASGPSSAASNVSRNGQGLPTSRGSVGIMSGAPAGGVGDGVTIAMSTGGRSGLTGRATEASARLGTSRGSGRLGTANAGGSSNGRQPATASIPSGMLQAEQDGELVFAGPQAPSGGATGGGRLNGPRIGSLPRQSAGLPGAGRGTASVARAKPGLPGGLGSRRLPGRATGQANRPKLATDGEVAAFINRTIPGISPIPSERVSAGFSMRTPEARKEAISKLGGSDQSEAAVQRALEWLAAHQYAAGNWSIHDPNCRDHTCTGNGSYKADPAATGLALLAFLGAGQTHRTGDYQQQVQLGLDWLIENQASNGDLFAAESEFAQFYSHGMAAIALCEAYGMTKDQSLKSAAQNAINFIAASQHPEFGGWRYQSQFESDTSVSGWQLMALKSGEMAGLDIPKSSYAGVATWLDSVESDESPGRFRYHPSKNVTDSMTAEGLLMRQYLGAGRKDGDLQAGASYLKSRAPRTDDRDVYYWYYATQVMFHMQGEHWDAWNAVLRDMLVDSQEKGGSGRGSWNPSTPTKDKWGQSGGRHYITCLNVLMLEVYYRHLPLYIELNP